MRLRLGFARLLLAAACAGSALVHGQSLADVARREEERRKTVKDAGKVYTNKDLKEVPAPPAAAGPPLVDSTNGQNPSASKDSEKEPQPGDTAKKAETDKAEQKDQAYWSKRMKALQSALEHDQIYADALQSRINALTTDFVNRDDPAQRGVIAVDRSKALAELERIKKAIADDKAAIADFEEEARRAGIPPGWLR